MSDDEQSSMDLSWVTFLDEEPRNDLICVNAICNSVAVWLMILCFPCGHFPDTQEVCHGHMEVLEEYFAEDEDVWASPARCQKCREPVQLLEIKPLKLG